VTAPPREDLDRQISSLLASHQVVGLTLPLAEDLLEGQVWPTLEVVIRDAPVRLRKADRPDLGLALIDARRSGHRPDPAGP
jgi:hypothetical protein